MSALRAVSRPARSLSPLVRQRRFASHDSHHHEEHDPTVYPKEGFSSPFWRNTVLVTLGFIAFAKFAPADFVSGKTSADGEYEAPWLTRVLAHHAPSIDDWTKTNEQHLAQSEERAQNTLIMQNAKPAAVVRYKNPLKFEQVSSHSVPVGGMSDMSDLLVKP